MEKGWNESQHDFLDQSHVATLCPDLRKWDRGGSAC